MYEQTTIECTRVFKFFLNAICCDIMPSIIENWISSAKSENQKLFADIPLSTFGQISDVMCIFSCDCIIVVI